MIRTPSRSELLFARSSLVTAACAMGLQAIDMVCVDYQNEEILREECSEGRQMGFTGKQAIHPNQIGPIQELFSPSPQGIHHYTSLPPLPPFPLLLAGCRLNPVLPPQDVEKANKIVAGYERYLKEGIGAFNLDGKMIDLPVVKWAKKVLARDQRSSKSR